MPPRGVCAHHEEGYKIRPEGSCKPGTADRPFVGAINRALLTSIPGVTLVPMDDDDLCCGSAGHYNLMQPETASRPVARKVAAIRASGADLVATADAGCAQQIEAGLRAEKTSIPVRHLLAMLAEAYRASQ